MQNSNHDRHLKIASSRTPISTGMLWIKQTIQGVIVRDCLPDLISCRLHLGLCLLSLSASVYSYVFLSFPLVFDIKGEEMMGFYNAAVKCQRTNLKREKDVKDDCVRL